MLEGLDAINWDELTHAYGQAGGKPQRIRLLASPEPKLFSAECGALGHERIAMGKRYDGFECRRLDDRHVIHCGFLPDRMRLGADRFETLWQLHPQEYHEIKIRGRLVKTPRWQQAFGVDYVYTGRVNKALPVPAVLSELLTWTQTTIDERLNGVLVNWYDGRLGHYIGRHRDSTQNMIQGGPIVTISFGQQRTFRLRPWRAEGTVDLTAADSAVFIMPYDTNRAWTHEVPRSTKLLGRRISVTMRAFDVATAGAL